MAAWGVVGLAFLAWGLLWLADWHWVGTLLVFGSRWVILVPVGILAVLAAFWCVRALLPVALAGLVVAWPVGCGLAGDGVVPVSARIALGKAADRWEQRAGGGGAAARVDVQYVGGPRG